ncbi:hypothetical protein CF319_g5573 [Tilletia indica]|nr:hypothetical protein CF319_g5573 [Tilletia indica]
MAYQDRSRNTDIVHQQANPGSSQKAVLGPGITKFEQNGFASRYPAPQIKRLQAWDDICSRPTDPDILKEMNILGQIRPECVKPLGTTNWRSWCIKIWAMLAVTPLAQRMLVGLEYGPGMDEADPFAYTSKYDKSFDRLLGAFLAQTVDDRLIQLVVSRLYEAGELRGTMMLDAVFQRYKRGMSAQDSLVFEELCQCKQGPTESIKDFGARLQTLYYRRWDIGQERYDEYQEESRVGRFLNRLRPEFKYMTAIFLAAESFNRSSSAEADLGSVIARFEHLELGQRRDAEREAEENNMQRQSSRRARGRGYRGVRGNG